MSIPVEFLPAARQDIADIEQYISEQGNPEAARRLSDQLIDRCSAIADLPLGGTPRDELEPQLRSIAFKRKATIFYRVDGEQVIIVAVLYRGRDPATHFGR